MNRNEAVSSAIRSMVFSVLASLIATYVLRRTFFRSGHDGEASGNNSTVVVIVPVFVGNSGNQFGGTSATPGS